MSENQKIKELLLAETPKDRVKFRIGRKYANNQRAHMLAYVDARYVQDRLDDVIGAENWSNSFEVIDNTLFCAITVVFPDGKVVTKTDCGTESNVEKEKGEASDAFKRAAVMLGIGRDLYDLPNHFNMHADLNQQGFPPKIGHRKAGAIITTKNNVMFKTIKSLLKSPSRLLKSQQLMLIQ